MGGSRASAASWEQSCHKSVRARCYPEDNDTPTDEVTDCAWDGAHGTVVAESVMDISPGGGTVHS